MVEGRKGNIADNKNGSKGRRNEGKDGTEN
jgi:hypothetical protein